MMYLSDVDEWMSTNIMPLWGDSAGLSKSGRCRTTDNLWFLRVYWLKHPVTKPKEHVLYYIQDRPAHGFE